MEMSGQLHASAALSPGKVTLVPIWYEAGWVPEPVWTRLWRETFPAPIGLEPPIIQPVAHCYTTHQSQAPYENDMEQKIGDVIMYLGKHLR
jgi:hypothetical protein